MSSRQLRWQQKQMSRGLCQKCGEKRNLYAALCDLCGHKARDAVRIRKKSKMWKPGGPGRPPKNFVATIEFADGKTRPVFEAPDRRQYVLNNRGRRIFGVWYYPREADTPIVIDNRDGSEE